MSKPNKVTRERSVEHTPEARGKRPKRVPIHKQASVLAVEEAPEGKVGRWVNDTNQGSRVHKFLQAGWEFVTSDGITSIEREAGGVVSRNVGQGITAYFMVIDQDLYDQDQADKEERNKATERAMYEATQRPGSYGKVDSEVFTGGK